jgi:methylthioribose-1-phosphate isomerase
VDQTRLPHEFVVTRLGSLDDAARAIRTMQVRGAPLIGVTAAYGVALALREAAGDADLDAARATLLATRPTAVNLRWALDVMEGALRPLPPGARFRAALARAEALAEEDVAINRSLGEHGLRLLRDLAAERGGRPLRILTHCNAGWLATVDWGTATAPIYRAHDAGLPVHVWVDETRPRCQGALTAWEMRQHGVPHTYVTDNAGGHLMQRGEVDLVLTGTDRTSRTGDVANKIGTYLKALAARDNGVPFYVALPSPTIDWTIEDGVREIPIEERAPDEVSAVRGRASDGGITSLTVVPDGTPVANPAFDVTPARLVTGFVTDRGVVEASAEGLGRLFGEVAGRG